MTGERKLDSIRYELIEIAEAEATKLFRMAWRAQKHGCNPETVEKIRSEARLLHMTGYPERLLDTFYRAKNFEYAFKI